MAHPEYATKIIDFGFAVRSKEKLQVFCGTPAYMSPEICRKNHYDGLASDVWASGIILYSMLFGVQPFSALTETELFRKILKGTFKMPAITDTNQFVGYPEIHDATAVRDLLSDILHPDETERITAKGILYKYGPWLN